jgi:hypothetical protein
MSGLLYPLLVPERPWKYISIDFKNISKDKGGFNTILVFVNWLEKRLILVLCYKTSIARKLAYYFITYI